MYLLTSTKFNKSRHFHFKVQSLIDQLEDKNKVTSDLEVKQKSLKSDMTAKSKHIKELEKEVCYSAKLKCLAYIR